MPRSLAPPLSQALASTIRVVNVTIGRNRTELRLN